MCNFRPFKNRPTKPTEQQTVMRGYREVTLPIKSHLYYKILFFRLDQNYICKYVLFYSVNIEYGFRRKRIQLPVDKGSPVLDHELSKEGGAVGQRGGQRGQLVGNLQSSSK